MALDIYEKHLNILSSTLKLPRSPFQTACPAGNIQITPACTLLLMALGICLSESIGLRWFLKALNVHKSLSSFLSFLFYESVVLDV